MDGSTSTLLRVAFACLVFSGCDRQAAPGGPAANGPPADTPFIMVLGTAQDGGVPQAGAHDHPAWTQPDRRHLATSLGLVDPATGERWMFEATPDFRQQWHALDTAAGKREKNVPDGIFLTHAHMGHYTGLMFLGHESLGATGVPVHAMEQMGAFLRTNGPWSQLVTLGNISLQPLAADSTIHLTERIRVTPLRVPHRQEFSEVVAYRIEGPTRSVLFVPDIDSWEEWDAEGTRLEDVLADVDLAYVDATFYADGEIPGRDMSTFPHPFIAHTMARLERASADTKAKIRFIHLNHTNPALVAASPERRAIEAAGFGVAVRGDMESL